MGRIILVSVLRLFNEGFRKALSFLRPQNNPQRMKKQKKIVDCLLLSDFRVTRTTNYKKRRAKITVIRTGSYFSKIVLEVLIMSKRDSLSVLNSLRVSDPQK